MLTYRLKRRHLLRGGYPFEARMLGTLMDLAGI